MPEGPLPQWVSHVPLVRRWMMFVDGENFTIRGQKGVEANGITLVEGPNYERDVFVWLPGIQPTYPMIPTVELSAIRASYYTSVYGDERKIDAIKERLWSLGFHPEVFKKFKKEEKAKGVDIALTKDLLSHAFLNHYEVAMLIAGDGDYVPLVNEVKRLGKIVYVAFFKCEGLSPELRLAADFFFDLTEYFINRWKSQG